MGLDSYLTKEIYVGANYSHSNVKGTISLTKGEDNTPIKVDLSKVLEIIEHVGYWRKANAIHNWFVENVQDGVDNCQKAYVSYKDLEALKEACEATKRILDQVPSATVEDDYKVWPQQLELPLVPTEGFFFGSTKIDSWFYRDLEDTIKIIEDLDKEGIYYYQSSW